MYVDQEDSPLSPKVILVSSKASSRPLLYGSLATNACLFLIYSHKCNKGEVQSTLPSWTLLRVG
jgi:hypothetical protein